MRSLHQALPTVVVGVNTSFRNCVCQDATSYAELPRFQQVSERLYRGAQPRDGGLG